MRSSVAAARASDPVNSLDLRGSNAGPLEVNSLDLALLRQAISDCRVQLKEIAHALTVDQGYLTRMLSGEKPFPLGKIAQLPPQVRRRFYHLGAGVPEPQVIGEWLIAMGEALLARLPERTNRVAKAGLR